MNLPEGISDRDLINSLFARVEMLEGSIRLYRAMATALASALTPAQQRAAMERLALLKADAITEILHPRGTGLRPNEVETRTRQNGFEGEWRALAELLQEHAPG